MKKIVIGSANCYNGDCMEFLKAIPDKFYDLAIVDPPYGVDLSGGRSKKCGWDKNIDWKKAHNWNNVAPDSKYFDNLFRTSKNQIIWGGNYFTNFLPPSQCWLFWDKGQRDFTLADGELAWCSFKKSIRVFNYSRSKNNKRQKFHPTQKPVDLYKWLLKNYAKEDYKILDTHGGSGSSAIACIQMGFSIDWIELDDDYFSAAIERISAANLEPWKHSKKTTLFSEDK